jgi:hypothetical protein
MGNNADCVYAGIGARELRINNKDMIICKLFLNINPHPLKDKISAYYIYEGKRKYKL